MKRFSLWTCLLLSGLLLTGCQRTAVLTPNPPIKFGVATSGTITLQQGATLSVVFTWYQSDGQTPVDLTGYTCGFFVRETASAGGQRLVWSSYCVLGGTAGTVTLTVPATVTTNYSVVNFGYYNLVLTAPDGVTVYRVWEGNLFVSPAV